MAFTSGSAGPDHHGMRHAAAEQIDALGKAAAQHEKERVGQRQRFLDPGGLRGEVGQRVAAAPRAAREPADSSACMMFPA